MYTILIIYCRWPLSMACSVLSHSQSSYAIAWSSCLRGDKRLAAVLAAADTAGSDDQQAAALAEVLGLRGSTSAARSVTRVTMFGQMVTVQLEMSGVDCRQKALLCEAYTGAQQVIRAGRSAQHQRRAAMDPWQLGRPSPGLILRHASRGVLAPDLCEVRSGARRASCAAKRHLHCCLVSCE
jgi:hypothetical protein